MKEEWQKKRYTATIQIKPATNTMGTEQLGCNFGIWIEPTFILWYSWGNRANNDREVCGSANLSSSPHEGKQWPAIELPLPHCSYIPQHGISVCLYMMQRSLEPDAHVRLCHVFSWRSSVTSSSMCNIQPRCVCLCVSMPITAAWQPQHATAGKYG